VSGVVTTSFNTVVRYGERLLAFVKARLPDDHTAIHAGSLRLAVDAQGDRLAVQVSSAPSRRLKRVGLDIDAATSAVHAHFGAWVPASPDRSGPDIGVSYTVMMEDDPYSVDRRIWLNPSGRVDLYWCLPAACRDDPVPIDVADFMRPLLMLTEFIRSSDYDRIYARRRLRFRRRFDWRFVAAMHIYDPDRRARSWVLRFPGPAPRRAADRQAFCPSVGYAATELRGWPTVRESGPLIRVALRSVLFHNGYHDVEEAVVSATTHLLATQPDQQVKDQQSFNAVPPEWPRV
jgi:hypothetical protein